MCVRVSIISCYGCEVCNFPTRVSTSSCALAAFSSASSRTTPLCRRRSARCSSRTRAYLASRLPSCATSRELYSRRDSVSLRSDATSAVRVVTLTDSTDGGRGDLDAAGLDDDDDDDNNDDDDDGRGAGPSKWASSLRTSPAYLTGTLICARSRVSLVAARVRRRRTLEPRSCVTTVRLTWNMVGWSSQVRVFSFAPGAHTLGRSFVRSFIHSFITPVLACCCCCCCFFPSLPKSYLLPRLALGRLARTRLVLPQYVPRFGM